MIFFFNRYAVCCRISVFFCCNDFVFYDIFIVYLDERVIILTMSDFLAYLTDVGLDGFFDMSVTDRPFFPVCRVGVCKRYCQWYLFSRSEDYEMYTYGVYDDEQDCFNSLFDLLPVIMIEMGIYEPCVSPALYIGRKYVIDYIMCEYGYSYTVACDMCCKLYKHVPVMIEFKKYMFDGTFISDKFAFSVHGYTAKSLFDSTKLSVLGAFNYLVYLIDEPDKAMAALRDGLSVK